jgi:hypothetical protein
VLNAICSGSCLITSAGSCCSPCSRWGPARRAVRAGPGVLATGMTLAAVVLMGGESTSSTWRRSPSSSRRGGRRESISWSGSGRPESRDPAATIREVRAGHLGLRRDDSAGIRLDRLFGARPGMARWATSSWRAP